MSIQNAQTKDSDQSKYLIASRLDISKILQVLAREAVQITANVGGGDFFLTSILEADEGADQVLIEVGKHNPHKERILAGQQISCSTHLEKIEIRFQLHSVALAETTEGEEVFLAPLPRELFRIQRRDHYRMPVSSMKPIKCTISSKKTQARWEFVVLDISCGGVALMTTQEVFKPEIGELYDCTLKLPDVELKTQIRARNVSTVTLTSKKGSQRSGFAFVDLPETGSAAIQRYLMQLGTSTRIGMK